MNIFFPVKYVTNSTPLSCDIPVHVSNLNQIFAYVKNLDKDNTGLVSGMLLYARTQEAIAPDLDATFGKNRIMVRTLDLNQDFDGIKMQLKSIADYLET